MTQDKNNDTIQKMTQDKIMTQDKDNDTRQR